MYTGILHLHITIVTIFLLSLVIKTVLLFVNPTLFDTVRNKTKVVEMILGPLVLLTGGYLFMTRGIYDEAWLNGKMILVLIGIPLSIIGLKKGNKVLALIGCLIFIYIYGVAETKSLKFKASKEATIENKA